MINRQRPHAVGNVNLSGIYTDNRIITVGLFSRLQLHRCRRVIVATCILLGVDRTHPTVVDFFRLVVLSVHTRHTVRRRGPWDRLLNGALTDNRLLYLMEGCLEQH